MKHVIKLKELSRIFYWGSCTSKGSSDAPEVHIYYFLAQVEIVMEYSIN